ncbi:UbiA family prenyltransferase [Nocardia transvalensis]|uniref:UbiA family prenyltransferase n=1 Tax=Nocardia transvalensis TaxID=37333 RepID=UPI001895E065|nr:UbiA family prenyltransferase [Nocardia transvalensis]MBF6333043.1 UbiA prenyltransferase family protein [Nocardia transvalensis]
MEGTSSNIDRSGGPGFLTADRFLQLPAAQRSAWARDSRGDRLKWWTRLRMFIAFSRPRTCVPGMLAFQLGLQLLDIPQSWRALVGLAVTFAISAIANLFNTYTDVDEDSENVPNRVFLMAVYGRARLLWHTWALCVVTLAASAAVGPLYFAVVLLALAGAHQYSFRPLRMKCRPLLGIALFATVVAYPFATIVAIAPQHVSRIFDFSFLVAAGYLFVWFCAKGLVKNVPDYFGDARARVLTSATVFGSREVAAAVAASATVAVYVGVFVPVAVGAMPVAALLAWLWMPVVLWQGRRLLAADTVRAGNDVLRTDMIVSCGFLATLILASRPTPANAGVVAVGALVILVSDAFQLDTRRKQDSH